MSRAEIAAALAHDVGKYVSRIARNVPEAGPMPAALVPLLAKDLYEQPGGGRPSARFEELAAALDDPRLPEARALLAEIDGLEPGVRGGDEAACLRAAAVARQLDVALRAIAAEAR